MNGLSKRLEQLERQLREQDEAPFRFFVCREGHICSTPDAPHFTFSIPPPGTWDDADDAP